MNEVNRTSSATMSETTASPAPARSALEVELEQLRGKIRALKAAQRQRESAYMENVLALQQELQSARSGGSEGGLVSTIVEALGRVRAKSRKLKNAKDIIRGHEDNIYDLQRALAKAERKTPRLEKECETVRAEFAELTAKVEVDQENMRVLVEELSQAETDIQVLDQSLSELEEALDEESRGHANAVAEARGLEQELKAARTESEALRRDLEAFQRRLAEERESWEQEVREREDDRAREAQTREAMLKSEGMKEVAALQAKVGERETELRAEAEKREAELRAEADVRAKELEKRLLTEAKEREKALKASLKEREKALKEEVEAANEKAAAERQALQALLKDKETVTAKAGEQERALAEKAREAQDMLESVQDELAALREEMKAADNSAGNRARELTQSLGEAKGELAELHVALAGANGKIAELEGALRDKEAENESLCRQVDDSSEDLKRARETEKRLARDLLEVQRQKVSTLLDDPEETIARLYGKIAELAPTHPILEECRRGNFDRANDKDLIFKLADALNYLSLREQKGPLPQ